MSKPSKSQILYDSQKALVKAEAEITHLRSLLAEAKRHHYYCEDCWYTCPMHPDGCCDESKPKKCNCGADEFNAKIEAALGAT